MFETLTERLHGVFRNLSRRGKLRPADVDNALQEIRLALLEADVHYQVVKGFLETVREEALSEVVSRSLNPAQQVVGILNRELIKTLGEPASLTLVGESRAQSCWWVYRVQVRPRLQQSWLVGCEVVVNACGWWRLIHVVLQRLNS